jgi:cell division protein FtsB
MEKIGKILKNRYVLILAIFIVWLAFFDQDNLFRQFKLTRELKEAQEKQEYYSSEFKKDSTLLEQLENDPEVMEKMAREKYLMKKDDEKIFLIVEDDQEK